MKEVLRNTLAAMAGALTGMMLLFAVLRFSQRYLVLPPNIDPTDRAALEVWFQSLPVNVLWLKLLGYFLGVLGGAHVAGRFSTDGGPRQAVMVTGLFTVASFLSLRAMPHPVWFWFANFAVVIGGGWLGIKLLPKRAAS